MVEHANNAPEFPDNENGTANGRAPRWDISQERAFLEALLGQRFNFLLVFFSIFIAGAVNIKNDRILLPAVILQPAVLTLGAIIAFFLAWAILRTQKKLDVILENLHPSHPHAIIERRMKLQTGRYFVGYVIPWICFTALALWAAYDWIILILHSHDAGRLTLIHSAFTPVFLMMALHLASSPAMSAA